MIPASGDTAPRFRFNPLDPGFRADPYPVYARLREDAPYLRTLGTLVLSRHIDVMRVLKSRRFSVDLIPQTITRHAARIGITGIDRVERFIRNSIVFTDNPGHIRLRHLIGQAYAPAAIADLPAIIDARVARLLDAMAAQAAAGGGTCELMSCLAAPLPVEVLCDWMRVPEAARRRIAPLIHTIRYLLDPGMMGRGQFQAVVDAMDELTGFFVAHARSVRSAGDGNLVARLADARSDGHEPLDEEEVAFACIMSFVAGTETTQCLIGNAVHLLLARPDQRALLRREAGPATAMIEEAIRFETPLQMTKRIAMDDCEIGGVTVAAGEQILLCLGSANRDPAAFPDPDRFDPARAGPPHVGFGYAMHACLGGTLARMQAEAAVTALFERYPGLEPPAAPVRWQKHSLILRGPAELPLAIGGAA